MYIGYVETSGIFDILLVSLGIPKAFPANYWDYVPCSAGTRGLEMDIPWMLGVTWDLR